MLIKRDKYEELGEDYRNKTVHTAACPAEDYQVAIKYDKIQAVDEVPAMDYNTIIVDISANMFDEIEVMPDKRDPEYYKVIRFKFRQAFELPIVKQVLKGVLEELNKLGE